jgi:hypothetical protein
MTRVQAFAEHGGISQEAATDYLSGCDMVVDLPGGAIVLRGDVVHIVARQRGLSGRRLIDATRGALLAFHKLRAQLKCPIKHGNKPALRYAAHFGFKPYHSTETHRWLYRSAGDPL